MAIRLSDLSEMPDSQVINRLVMHMQSNSAFYLSISNEQLDILAGSRQLPFKELYYLFLGAIIGAIPGFIQNSMNMIDYHTLNSREAIFGAFNIFYFSCIITGLALSCIFFFKERKKKDALLSKIRSQTVPILEVSLPEPLEYFQMMKA